tara:strand:- start:559 stop:834 length:276 start_codon:yes stop_codon:yes gene_type:complete
MFEMPTLADGYKDAGTGRSAPTPSTFTFDPDSNPLQLASFYAATGARSPFSFGGPTSNSASSSKILGLEQEDWIKLVVGAVALAVLARIIR